MLNSKRGQVSVEFMMLIGFLFLVFIIFIMIISNNMISMRENRIASVLENVGEVIESEVKLAQNVKEGYTKEFYLPSNVDGKPYLIENRTNPGYQTELRIKYHPSLNLTDVHIMTLPANAYVDSQIINGINIIQKNDDGNIHIN